MGTFVASLAGFSRQLGKIVDSLDIWYLRAPTSLWSVAFETGHPFMLAGDGIASMHIMVKLNQMPPGNIVVASLTQLQSTLLGGHFIAKSMVILVAGGAGRVRACKVEILVSRRLDPGILFVAVKTSDFGMGTFKNKAGNLVLKLFDTPSGLGVALFTFAAAESRFEMILVMIGVASEATFLV